MSLLDEGTHKCINDCNQCGIVYIAPKLCLFIQCVPLCVCL